MHHVIVKWPGYTVTSDFYEGTVTARSSEKLVRQEVKWLAYIQVYILTRLSDMQHRHTEGLQYKYSI